MFKVDGKDYTALVTSLDRLFEVADSESTGRTKDWRMHRDVIGTFYNYSLEINTFSLTKEKYDELYKILSAPQESHTMTFPYGQETLTFEAYVTKGKDTLKRISENGNLWSGLTVNFIAISPQRRA